MPSLAERQPTAVSPATPQRRRTSRGRLLVTVSVATIAALVCFTVFYVIGAVLGLAVIAAVGVAALVGLAWVSLKLGARSVRRASNSAPDPLP